MSRFTARPSRRDQLQRERAALIAEAGEIDAGFQRTALRMATIRAELTRLRELLWPAGDGRGWRGFRRPRVGGPAPVGRPAPPALPLRGRALRGAALAVLVRARRPLALPDIHRALHVGGYAVAGSTPVKALADALGYEHDRGRAHRISRGIYELGELTPARRRRLLERGHHFGHEVARLGGVEPHAHARSA
jgi:hypothetical protein